MENQEQFIDLEEAGNDQALPDAPTIDLTEGQAPTVTLEGDALKDRAVKAHIALGSDSPGVEANEIAIKSGREQELRISAAQRKDSDNLRYKTRLIEDIAREKQGNLSDEELAVISQAVNSGKVDPNTVFEMDYGMTLVNRLALSNDDVNAPMANLSDEQLDRMDLSTQVLAKQELIKNKIAELKSIQKEQSWPGYIGDIAGTIVPGRTWYGQQNAIPNTNNAGILPGSNLEDQVANLWYKDMSSFRNDFNQAVDGMTASNLQMAIDFAESMLGQSATNTFLRNTMGLLDTADLTAIGKLGVKGGALAVKALIESSPRAALTPSAPPVPQGMVRVYHGGGEANPSTYGDGVWVSTDRKYAEGYASKQPNGGSVYYTDLPKNDPRINNLDIPDQGVEQGFTFNFKLDAAESQDFKALSDLIKANARHNSTEAGAIYEAAGDAVSASKVNVAKAVTNVNAPKTAGAQVVQSVANLLPTVPSIFRPSSLLGTGLPTGISSTMAARILAKLNHQAGQLVQGLTTPGVVARLNEPAYDIAYRVAEQDVREQFIHAPNMIVDIKKDIADIGLNLRRLEIKLGKPDGTAFTSTGQAQAMADLEGLIPGTYKIEQQGNAAYIKVIKDVGEEVDVVRDGLIQTNTVAPKNNPLSDLISRWVKTPDEILSEAQNENRKVATVATSKTMQMAREVAKSLKLSPDQKTNLSRILRDNRDWIDPNTGDRGRFWDSLSDLDNAYRRAFNRGVSEKEATAYFSYKQLSDYDWMQRNLQVYTTKARKGYERFSFAFSVPDQNGVFKTMSTDMFEGRVEKNLPGKDYLNILIYDPQIGGKGRIVTPDNLTPVSKQEMKDMMNNGFQLIRIGDPRARPLKDVAGTNFPIQYVLTKGTTRGPLDPIQVPYRPGGHVLYSDPHWIKQAKIYQGNNGGFFYEGDVSVFNSASSTQAKKLTELLEQARQFVKNNDMAGLNAMSHKLPMSAKTLKDWFDQKFLDVDQPFAYTKSGYKTADTDNLKMKYPNILDLTTEDYNMMDDVNISFLGDRSQNVKAIENTGTETSPLFKFRQSELVDPITTMSQAITNLTRDKYFNDYKVMAAENFIQQYGDTLAADLSDLRRNPMKHLYNPVFNPAADRMRVERAKAERDAVLTFTGMSTDFGRNINAIKESLAESIFGSSGRNVGVADESLVKGLIRDPIQYARSIAFHTSQGLFNWVQLFVQSQSLAHVLALSPSNAIQSVAASFYTNALQLGGGGDAIKKHFAALSRGFGWDPQHFEEAHNALMKSGWNLVGGESSWRNDAMDQTIIQRGTSQFMDAGAAFFNVAERGLRTTGYFAAYREWRKANPRALMTPEVERQIINRADLLTVNMTRASNAKYQAGLMSIPTQFSAYSIRLAEQMMGGRLTVAEKMRVSMVYSALYGLPIGTAGIAGVPAYEYFKEKYIERGLGEGPAGLAAKAIMDGVVAAGTTAITGKDFNIAQRYGPDGVSFVKDILRGDKGFFESLIGPAGKKTADIIGSSAGIVKGIQDLFSDENPTYQPLINDMIEVGKNIATGNNIHRMIVAANTGKYVLKDGRSVTSVDSFSNVFSGITGLSPGEVSDTFLKQGSMRDQKAVEDKAIKEYSKEWRNAMSAMRSGDENLYKAYMARAKATLMHVSPSRRHEAWLRATDNQDLEDVVNHRFWSRAPAEEGQARRDRAIRGN